MNGSRRAFLAAAGAAVAIGVGGHPAAATDTNADPRPAGEVTVSGGAPALTDVVAAFEREHPDVSVSSVDGGVERFARGEADVLHAVRPLAAAERERAGENGVAFAVAGLPLGGVAALGRDEGWCRCLRASDGDAFEGRGDVETWSELPGDVPGDLDPADLPGTGADVLVHGTRPHQYAVGHGGTALYEAAPAAFVPFEERQERLTPAVKLEFAYVDRAALEREPVAALARFQEAASSDVEHFAVPDLVGG